MIIDDEYNINVGVNEVFRSFKILDNEGTYFDTVKTNKANEAPSCDQIYSESVDVDSVASPRKKLPEFKLEFPHSEKMVRKTPLSTNDKNKPCAAIDRVI